MADLPKTSSYLKKVARPNTTQLELLLPTIKTITLCYFFLENYSN